MTCRLSNYENGLGRVGSMTHAWLIVKASRNVGGGSNY